MVRIAIVDDEALVRAALRSILESSGDIRVVADCDGHDALAAVTATRPALVLLDAVMPAPDDGLTVLRALRALPSPPAVAMLTAFDTSAHIHAAMAAGATGFLLKDTAVGTLIDAVRVLASGGTVFTPTVGRAVVDGFLGDTAHSAAGTTSGFGPGFGTGSAAGSVPGAAAGGSAGLPAAATGPSAGPERSGGPGGRGAAENPYEAALAPLTFREREVLRLLAGGLPNAAIAATLGISVGTVKDHVRAVLRKLDAPNRVAAAVIAHQAGLDRVPGCP
ncbi:response regulator transcription factor [Streptomyces sp. NPDC051976]|uniref:response regulator transcription factor n=1 Tax=Streptomyces sp. NPDC051976 TaxID=3154947 RepID=UPI003432BCB0